MALNAHLPILRLVSLLRLVEKQLHIFRENQPVLLLNSYSCKQDLGQRDNLHQRLCRLCVLEEKVPEGVLLSHRFLLHLQTQYHQLIT